MTIDPRFGALEQALARLETRVAELELRELATRRRCEVCRARGDHNVPAESNCFLCCRDLCAEHLLAPTCAHDKDGRHEPRNPDGSRR
jgi:hypothetical protein